MIQYHEKKEKFRSMHLTLLIMKPQSHTEEDLLETGLRLDLGEHWKSSIVSFKLPTVPTMPLKVFGCLV